MDFWLPPKPAIIRPAPADLHRFGEPKKANLLPGWFPAAAFSGAPLTLSFVASAIGDEDSVVAPATVLAGDVIVVFNCLRDNLGTIPTTAVPSGFTSAVNTSAGGALSARAICSYKIAVGNEDGTTLNGMSIGAGEIGDPSGVLLLMFRGSRPVTGVTVGSANGTIVSGNPAGQTVTASGGAAPLIVLGAYMANNVIDNTTFTPTGDSSGQVTFANQHMEFNYGIFNTSPQNVSVDNDDEGGGFNGLQSFYLAMNG